MSVLIQFQDLTGNWRTVNQLTNANFIAINMALESVARQHNSRARAVDANTGSIVDLRG